MKKFAIAIDGPAGAGKSTIAKKVAAKLGIVYVDTGAMYRTAALYMIRAGIDIKNEREKLLDNLDNIKMDIVYNEKGQRMYLGEEDVSEKIREEIVSMGASDIAVIPEVRLKLVLLQRALASSKSVIMDGRDIGTYVLPDAELKIFLTASATERANRRFKENTEKGISCTYDDVLADIKKRDKNDSERSFAPLKQADDAVLVDSTEMSEEEVLEKILSLTKDII